MEFTPEDIDALPEASFLVPLPDNIIWPREFHEILDSHGLVG